jgi:hypothetical protein
VRPGQRVRFLFLRGNKNVHAWDLPVKPDPRKLDSERYAELMIRAASNIFQPLGVSEERLTDMVLERGMADELKFVSERVKLSVHNKNNQAPYLLITG